MDKFLRENKVASVILAIIRVWLGIEWTLAGWEKITSHPAFDPAGFFMETIKAPVMTPEKTQAYPWFNDLVKNVFMPHSKMFGFMVSWGEFLIGLGLIFGCLTTAAVFFAMMMNFTYLLSGTVSVNPEYLFFEIFLIVAGFNASKIGLDYWVIPWVRKHIFRKTA
ncbi:DoxX family membrane protein [Companilactobacillus sp. DQM5]|uniref:DoxX family membrane protein n=1 Tax=Companilactobacillus sp. DQM5 TaxID=3463359 RepID=UPI00405828C1